VINALRKLRQRFRLGGSLNRGDFSGEGKRQVDNVEAMAAAGGRDPGDNVGDSTYPPGYVKSYDEGRPRK